MTMRKGNVLYWILLPLLAIVLIGCSESDDDNSGGKTPKLPDTNVVLSE
jgi:hypothetical protein